MANLSGGGTPTPSIPNPVMKFLREAITAVPAVRYALGVGGIAAVIAIVAGFLDLKIALVGIPILFVFMVILVLFSHLAASGSAAIRRAIEVLVWFCVFALIVATVLFSITFFVRQDVLRGWGLNSFYELFNLQPSPAVQLRNSDYYINGLEEAWSGAGDPKETVAALGRIADFWRRDKQRQALREWRCQPKVDNKIFVIAAQYVFANEALRQDIDKVTRYYDAVARCTLDKHCDQDAICSYFYQNMQDFRALYTRYFQELAVIEARDPLKNIRTLISACYSKLGSAPLKDEAKIECPTS